MRLRNFIFAAVLTALTAVTAFADSPLASTDFSKAYMDEPIVGAAKDANGVINSRLMEYLASECDTIGYGYPGEEKIFTYTCLIDEEGSMAEMAGNLAHEWSHKLGFKHRADDHSEKYETVPYVFGDLVEEHTARLIEGEGSQ